MSIAEQLHLLPGDKFYNRWEHLSSLSNQLNSWYDKPQKYPLLYDLYIHELKGEGGLDIVYPNICYGYFLKEAIVKSQFPDGLGWEHLNQHDQHLHFNNLMAAFQLAIFVETIKNGFPDATLRQIY